MPQKYNYKKLLKKDSNFKRWYNNIRRASPASADANLRRIGYVCRVFKTSTSQLATLTPKQGFDIIDDVITKLDKEGKQGEYMRDYAKALKSWFAHNNIQITQKIKVPKSDGSSKVSQEQSPTPDQFRRVLDAAGLKQKVEATLVGFSGLRLETLGDYESQDGLEVKDMPEMMIDSKNMTVKFVKIPSIILVRPNLSKAGHQYFTFMPEEECEYVKELLEYRMMGGETINPDSPLIVSLRYHQGWLERRYTRKDQLYIDNSGHIKTGNVSDSTRTAIRKAGFDWRPYILRTYFDTRMMMAEADGLIIRDWRVFWMGHKGDIEHRYTLNKGRLPDDLIEKMREGFSKASEKYLVTRKIHDATKERIKAEFNKSFLEISGYTQADIDKLGDLSKYSADEMRSLIKEASKRQLGLNGNSQKVVPLSDLEVYIADGWEFVRDLPPNKAVIKLPNAQSLRNLVGILHR